jgi:hypothetical protein
MQNLGVYKPDNENVGGLDVAMDDAAGMRRVKTIGNLNCQ